MPIAGRSNKNRINSAYVKDDPTRLIGTIYNNFGIWPDHFIQIDFCAFKTIVNGLDGVAVPFEYPARDVNTGLYVAEPGCFTFDGDHALAYVRSRKYQYYVDGKWKSDPVSDLGRVSRQQDFLRRRAVGRARPWRHRPRRCPQPDRRRPAERGGRQEPHDQQDARVRGRAAQLRPGQHRHVPDRGRGCDDQRQLGAAASHQRREHAVDPGHLPRRGVVVGGARAGVRHHHDRGTGHRDHRRRRADHHHPGRYDDDVDHDDRRRRARGDRPRGEPEGHRPTRDMQC
ncbi:MAG: LCP family protein [Ilumatobacteraceae bacterium]